MKGGKQPITEAEAIRMLDAYMNPARMLMLTSGGRAAGPLDPNEALTRLRNALRIGRWQIALRYWLGRGETCRNLPLVASAHRCNDSADRRSIAERHRGRYCQGVDVSRRAAFLQALGRNSRPGRTECLECRSTASWARQCDQANYYPWIVVATAVGIARGPEW